MNCQFDVHSPRFAVGPITYKSDRVGEAKFSLLRMSKAKQQFQNSREYITFTFKVL